MDAELYHLLLRYQWCNDHDNCIGCETSLSLESIPCVRCSECRYCSILCFLKDRNRHRVVCDFLLNFKGVSCPFPEDAFKIFESVLCRAKPLDSKGDYAAPAVIYEAVIVKDSNLFAQYISQRLLKLEAGNRANHRQGQGQNLTNEQKTPKVNERNTSKSKSDPNVFQYGASFRPKDNSCHVFQLQNGCFGISHVTTPKIVDKDSSQNTSDSFGVGWWKGRLANANKSASSKSKSDSDATKTDKGEKKQSEEGKKQSGEGKKQSGEDKKQSGEGKKNHHKENSSTLNISGTTDSTKYTGQRGANGMNTTCPITGGRNAGDRETRRNEDLNSWGAGWWGQKKTSTPKKSMQVNNSKQAYANSNTKNRSSGGDCPASNNVRSGINSKNITSSASFSSRNSSNVTPTNSNTDDRHTRISPGGNTAANSYTRKNSESDTFGDGWWKKPTVDKKKKKTTAESQTRKTSNAARKVHTTSNYPGVANTCLDIVPHQINITPESLLRFGKVASRIASIVIQKEKQHGRVLVMSLHLVPGLWRASLGGSRISLVVEIIARYPSSMPGIVIRDKFGKTAPVLLNTSESAVYDIPGTRGMFSANMHDCLLPGTFIILRGVKWEWLPERKLGIIMEDMKNVDFIFYEHLD